MKYYFFSLQFKIYIIILINISFNKKIIHYKKIDSIKLIVVGEKPAGKTTIISQYINNFISQEYMTMSPDKSIKEIELENKNIN